MAAAFIPRGMWSAAIFLHLVRFGIRSANDPIVRDSIEVIDRVLKRDLPQGPGWRRYNHDGYGEKVLLEARSALARPELASERAMRFFMLATASVSMIGYENCLSQPVIRLWNDTHQVGD